MSSLNDLVNGIDASLDEYERKHKDKEGKAVLAVLLAYHTGTFSPAPISRSDVETLYSYLKKLKKEKVSDKVDEVHVILHSFGGDPDAAYQMSRVLYRFGKDLKARVVYVIPRYAKSAATLMVLGGSEVKMTEIAELGPIDPQVSFEGQWVSAKTLKSSMTSILEAMVDILNGFVEGKDRIDERAEKVLHETVEALTDSVVSRFVGIGEYESLIEYSKHLAKDLLQLDMFPKESGSPGHKAANLDEIVDRLTTSYPSHGMVIDHQAAANLGLKVNKVDEEEEDILLKVYKNLAELFRRIDIIGSGLSKQLRVEYLPSYPWVIRHGIIMLPWPSPPQSSPRT